MNPFERHTSRWTSNRTLPGTPRFANCLPVTLSSKSDNSLLDTFGNDANKFLIDTPNTF